MAASNVSALPALAYAQTKTMSNYIEYQPVPVSEAVRIADGFGKEIVVILAYDAVKQMTHTTTFGKQPASKGIAAKWGEVCTEAIGARVMESTWYEDYRATKEADYKAVVDELVTALRIVQWAGAYNGLVSCPVCDGTVRSGHKENCYIASAIEKANVLIKTPAGAAKS